MKKKLKKILNTQFFQPVWNSYSSDSSFIVMLHRVCDFDNSKLAQNEGLKVTPGFLEEFILNCLNSDYEFVSLENLCEGISLNVKKKRQIVVTLDDGYLDNFVYAYPIFLKYKIPFTIYVTTSFINREYYPWWFKLEEVIVENKMINWLGCDYLVESKAEKEKLFHLIRNNVLSNSFEAANDLLEDLFLRYKANIKSDLFLTWAHLKELASNNLVTIGSHGHSHRHLTGISSEEIVTDINECNQNIFKHLNCSPEHFCYPYGAVSSKVFEVVEKFKFTSCTTTRAGRINFNKNQMIKLPRIFLEEGLTLSDVYKQIALSEKLGFKDLL